MNAFEAGHGYGVGEGGFKLLPANATIGRGLQDV